MIAAYDELLSEEQIERMKERDEDLQFATIVFNEHGQLVIDLDPDKGASVGVPGM